MQVACKKKHYLETTLDMIDEKGTMDNIHNRLPRACNNKKREDNDKNVVNYY